jgi:hypothetical protein
MSFSGSCKNPNGHWLKPTPKNADSGQNCFLTLGCEICRRDSTPARSHCADSFPEIFGSPRRLGNHFLSMASIAASLQSTCGSERRPPECGTQRSPADTPHVGQATVLGGYTPTCERRHRCSGFHYPILTWNIREGLPDATAYHSPSAPIMKYTSCW